MGKYMSLLVLTLIGCGSQDVQYYDHHIAAVAIASDEVFPGPQLYDQEARSGLASAKHIDDLLVFERAIPLEANDEGMIGVITSLIHAGGRYYVSDRVTNGLYCFDDKGSFLFKFGKEGEEYDMVRVLDTCFDGSIGVSDPFQGKVLLYDRDGKFLRASEPIVDGRKISVSYRFSWEHEDELVVTRFQSRNGDTAENVVLDGRKHPHVVRFGFGQRQPEVHATYLKGGGLRVLSAFAKVNGHFWVGSPYRAGIQIYDGQGRPMAILGADRKRDPEQYFNRDDLAKLTTSDHDQSEKLLDKMGNLSLLRVGNMVLAQVGGLIDVYDLNGNTLLTGLDCGNLQVMAAFDDTLVLYLLPGMPLDLIGSKRLLDAINEGNFRAHNNPVLFLYHLRQS